MGDSGEEAEQDKKEAYEVEQDKKEVYEVEQKGDRNQGLHINDVITQGRAGRGRPKDNR